jgi:hypothetical protein
MANVILVKITPLINLRCPALHLLYDSEVTHSDSKLAGYRFLHAILSLADTTIKQSLFAIPLSPHLKTSFNLQLTSISSNRTAPARIAPIRIANSHSTTFKLLPTPITPSMCNSPNSVIFPWTHLYHPAYISAPLPLRLQRSSLPLTLTFSPPPAPVPTPLPLAPTCLLRIAYTSLDPCTAMTVPVTLALDLLLLTAPSVFGKRCNVLRAAHGVIKRLGAPNLPNTHYLPRLFMHTQPTLNVLPHHGRHSTLLPHASRLLSPDPALHPRVALPPSPVVSLCPLYPCPCSMPTSSNTILSMILTRMPTLMF